MIQAYHQILTIVCLVGIAGIFLGMLVMSAWSSVTGLFAAARRNIRSAVVVVPLASIAFYAGATKPDHPNPPDPPLPVFRLSDVVSGPHAITFRLQVPESMVGSYASVETKKRAEGAVWFAGYDRFTVTGTNETYTVEGDFVGGKLDRVLRVRINGAESQEVDGE